MPLTTSVGSGEPTSWRIWWEHNRDPYLDLRPVVRLRQRPSGDGNFYLGQGSGQEALDLTVRRDQLLDEVLPTLRSALAAGGSVAMRRRALLALAKLSAAACDAEAFDRFGLFEAYLADGDLEVSKTSAVCLGLTGGPEAIVALSHLLMASDRGGELNGRGRVGLDMRVNAAYALGLAGSRARSLDEGRFVLHFLTRAIETDRSASPDLVSACVAAIGVVPMPVRGGTLADAEDEPLNTSREAQLAALLALIDDDDLRRVSRAHAFTAIGRLMVAENGTQLVDRALLVRKLTRALRSSAREPREVRQSIVLALGSLADGDLDDADVMIRKALEGATADSDHLTRHFAMISLAQAAGRPGDAEQDVIAGSEPARKHLLRILARGKGRTRPWAALALGILGHGIKEGGRHPSDDVGRALGELLRSAKNPETVGALAIAIGLRGDGQHRALLEERLGRYEGDEITRSEIAVSMGLLGAAASEEALRELFDAASAQPWLLREVSIARALLGDYRLAEDLIAALAEVETLGGRVGIAGALGHVGESRTIAPITAALGERDATALGRSYLVAALGEICDEAELPWTATYALGVNYGAAPATLEQGRDQGLLNLD